MTTESLAPLIAVLKEKAEEIRSREAAARRALYEKGDKERYRRQLLAKTELLIGLPAVAAEALGAAPAAQRQRIGARLARFAASAARARELGSIFYMAALLYPPDYREGEPNDLELFIAGLEGEDRGGGAH